MLRSIVSSIEFEKFRRNWSEKNSMKRFLRKRFRSLEETQRLAPSTQQNAFYESVLGRSK
ncbi:hypothetical protein [Leptospira noguchii]|uniref:hypothetical protein n=1 Tax=Leptospira noguchii TaxID=28182 RepID=UPI001FB5EA03|nr:hypothetical protein [Leptospira noguchii]UOG59387.1 hypothetical protein MAL07_11260 [Leptospira noguchii]